MDVTKEGLGDQFEAMLEKYFGECVVSLLPFMVGIIDAVLGICMTMWRSDTFYLVLAGYTWYVKHLHVPYLKH
jgi:hypothetical protein